KNRNLSTDFRPGYFITEAQLPFDQMTLIVRTSGDPHSLATAVQREVSQMDPEIPVYSIKTMEEYISATVATPRFNTTLLAIFAAVALILTIVGLYGVMSYSVAQRTNEIGIRMAFAATKVIESLLFGVTTKDPWTFGAVAVLLSLVALLACYLPARRASRVDPIEALHYE